MTATIPDQGFVITPVETDTPRALCSRLNCATLPAPNPDRHNYRPLPLSTSTSLQSGLHYRLRYYRLLPVYHH
jgi:hypothetical protein